MRKWLVRLALVLVSLALVELVFRGALLARGTGYDSAATEAAIRAHLAEFGGKTFLEKNARTRRREEGGELVGRVPHPFIGWQTRRGRADLEHKIELGARRTDDEYVIWVVGGSVAGLFGRQGWGSDRLIELLAEEERLAGREIVLHRYALAAFKQPQQLMYVGYLFSLGVYARREARSAGFLDRYEALLRDTGRTTAEELAHKYLDADLTQPDFWRGTIRMLESRIDHFETLVGQAAG